MLVEKQIFFFNSNKNMHFRVKLFFSRSHKNEKTLIRKHEVI